MPRRGAPVGHLDVELHRDAGMQSRRFGKHLDRSPCVVDRPHLGDCQLGFKPSVTAEPSVVASLDLNLPGIGEVVITVFLIVTTTVYCGIHRVESHPEVHLHAESRRVDSARHNLESLHYSAAPIGEGELPDLVPEAE